MPFTLPKVFKTSYGDLRYHQVVTNHSCYVLSKFLIHNVGSESGGSGFFTQQYVFIASPDSSAGTNYMNKVLGMQEVLPRIIMPLILLSVYMSNAFQTKIK